MKELIAEDLRIGNIINFPFIGADVEVIGLALKSEGGLYIQSKLSNNTFFELPKKYKPIPLIEEWLVRFGFEVFTFDNGNPNQYRIENRLFVIRDGKIVDYGTSLVIDFVHDLQNFIHILEKKELILEEK